MTKLITPESPLLIPPLLAAEIGLNEAVILQQIHYLCQISKHIKEDGRRWFWKTLNDWSQTLPFLKPSAIRRAIANLKDTFQLIDVKRHSEKTWYQANWFTINVESIEALWNRICQNQQIDVEELNISMRSLQTDDIKDFPEKTFSTQQHAAAFKKNETNQELKPVPPETENLEQSQATPFAVEPEQIDSTNEIDPDEDLSSPPQVEAISTSDKPTKGQIKEICTELKRMRVNPDPCLGVIKKYWGNVAGAITRVKEAIQEGWCDNPTGLFINSCKSGAKGKNAMPSDVTNWFDWAYKKRIVLALQGGFVYLPSGDPMPIEEMMQRYPMEES